MSYSQKFKDKCRTLYVYQRMSILDIAAQEGVTDNTLYLWKKDAAQNGDDWDRARAATRLAADGIDVLTTQVLEDYALLTQNFMARLKEQKSEDIDYLKVSEAMSRIADAYMKMSNAVKRANPKLNELTLATKILKLQEQFIRSHFPQHLEAFAQILQPFSVELNKVLTK